MGAIMVRYANGSAEMVPTDERWTAGNVVQGFEDPQTSPDPSWKPVKGIARFGQGQWGLNVAVSAPDFTLTNSSWIWTSSEANSPAGNRAFRTTQMSPAGLNAVKADILIDADDRFTLYVNGQSIGSKDGWETAALFNGVALAPSRNFFAVNATNLPDATTGGASPAALIAAIQITYTDGSVEILPSGGDGSWVTSDDVGGVTQTKFDESTWKTAVAVGKYGDAPWGTVGVGTQSISLAPSSSYKYQPPTGTTGRPTAS
jgi:hypothetical protein